MFTVESVYLDLMIMLPLENRFEDFRFSRANTKYEKVQALERDL